ncbi:MAG: SpoIID/LytB domain-containing protein [Acidimicrobiales bacterium]
MIRIPRPTARRLCNVAVALFVVLASVVPLTTSATPAAAAPVTTADIDGRGWGHGRGMSQYGAFGYARDRGWSRDQILDHYYGGTTAGQAATAGGVTIDPNRVRIRLMALDGQIGTLVGTGSESTLEVVELPDLEIPEETRALRMLRNGNTWNIEASASCNGPWEQIGSSTAKIVTVRRSSGTDELYTCNPDGTRRHYAGEIRAQVTDVGTRTMNVTTIEEYLRGVVPNEMPSSWIADALQVQAVAARSYAMAGDNRHRNNDGSLYADTCDTTTCQVYKGRFTQASPTSTKEAATSTRTDAAIAATAGVVRVFTGTGRLARTEFSSTSGGWTAGGDFPAVEDLGDSISPVHTWSLENVSLAPLASLGTGNLIGITVTERNGLGADGGRVRKVRLDFDGQGSSVIVDGNTIRSRLGLRSDWFIVKDVPPPLPPSGFYDVPADSFYEEAVTWASEEGITTGCTATTFCPGSDVTRAQAATFLWRNNGEPTSSGAQFDDVEDDAYYFDAVRWVRDQGITTGCTETQFCPNGNATRAQLVAFLWRHARSPIVAGDHGFTDIPEDSYYFDAVNWAVRRGITTGTSATTFSPNDSVSRGQTVLFLHRYLG